MTAQERRTAKRLRALELHATRLERAAETAQRHYEQLRGAFPEYPMGVDGGLLMDAARATDDAARAARGFRQQLDNFAARQ